MSDSSSSLPRSNTAADGFDVVCVAIGEYQHSEDHPNLPADEEAVLLIELLRELGGEPDPWQPAGESGNRTEVQARLDHWARIERARSSMLFWVGHGSSDGNDAFLATYESRLGRGCRARRPCSPDQGRVGISERRRRRMDDRRGRGLRIQKIRAAA